METQKTSPISQADRPLLNKTIVLGITGSIAAYKGADLASKLAQDGAMVLAVMTREAREFITPTTLAALTGQPVITEMFGNDGNPGITHVELGRMADIVVIAPATANVIAKLAAGISDDELTCTVLATQAPVLIVPAMHTAMYQNKATQDNIARLKGRGVMFIGPVAGRLASGQSGPGRFSENADVIGAVRQALGRKGDLAGRRIVVTAGGTQEPIDPVRFITNRSSGKMGYAVAVAARDRGAEVTLITTPTSLPKPYGVRVLPVNTAVEMLEAVRSTAASADALVMAAAVGDYRVAQVSPGKIKHGRGNLVLELAPNPDILKEVKGNFVRVGFAAETGNLIANAQKKVQEKELDLIVANDVTVAGSGFGSDDNQVTLIDRTCAVEELPLLPKRVVANRILDKIAGILRSRVGPAR